MNAAVLKEYGQFFWQDVPVPEIHENEVLIRVKYAGICGTDQHIFSGEFHPRTHLPLIPGHEFTGEIAEAGRKTRNVKVGDRVVVDPIIWCGECTACKVGQYPACNNLKLLGVDLDGGFAEFVTAHEDMLYKIPDHLPYEHAALVELFSIGFHACNRAGVMPDDIVVIWGTGKVGHCILQAVRTKTRNIIIMVDILEQRLKIAKQAFPEVITINATETDPVDEIMRITSKRGADIAFEAVGHAKEIDQLIHPVRGCIQSIRGAGKICVLGQSNQQAPLIMKELIWKEAEIIASRVSQGEFAEAIENMAKGNLKPGILITSILPAEEVQNAFTLLEDKPESQLKILIKIPDA